MAKKTKTKKKKKMINNWRPKRMKAISAIFIMWCPKIRSRGKIDSLGQILAHILFDLQSEDDDDNDNNIADYRRAP